VTPSKLRVGVVVTSTEHGGAEAHIARIWTSSVVAARARAHLLGSLPQWSSTELPATDLGTGAKWSYRRAVSSVASMPLVVRRSRATIREVDRTEHFDAFYAHFKREQVLYTSSLASIAPTIWMEHGHFPGGRLRRPLAAAYRRVAERTAAIVCLSASVKAELEGILGSGAPEPIVIENAIEPGWTTPASEVERDDARRSLGIPTDAEMVVAVVARLIPRKRVELAIAAAALLPSCWVVVCGDGPLAESLRAQAAGNPRVVFTGFRTDPRPVYAASDVLLLASWEEGFGHVLLEGASAGLPAVVVTDGGLSASVAGWGAVADAPTGGAVAEALVHAATLPSGAARRWADAHDPDSWGRAHLAVLERAVSG